MQFFKDLFGGKKRTSPRIAIDWWVDAQLPATDGFIGFHANDISSFGLRLSGESDEAFKRVLTDEGRARMLLRVPGEAVTHSVEAQLVWGMGGQDRFQTGWTFEEIEGDLSLLQQRLDGPWEDDSFLVLPSGAGIERVTTTPLFRSSWRREPTTRVDDRG